MAFYYRSNAERLFLKAARIEKLDDDNYREIDWLRKAKTLIIWGIAFNVYDAELISLFQSPPFNELKEIVIANPNSGHRYIANEIVGEGVMDRIYIDPTTGEQV